MKIVNQTKHTLLAQKALVADTIFKRTKGLLGRNSMDNGEGLIITPCNSIHTFFMQFPIDVVFVDKHNKVVACIANVKPFRLSPVYFNASFVIELPSGVLNSTLTQNGDTLLVQ